MIDISEVHGGKRKGNIHKLLQGKFSIDGSEKNFHCESGQILEDVVHFVNSLSLEVHKTRLNKVLSNPA